MSTCLHIELNTRSKTMFSCNLFLSSLWVVFLCLTHKTCKRSMVYAEQPLTVDAYKIQHSIKNKIVFIYQKLALKSPVTGFTLECRSGSSHQSTTNKNLRNFCYKTSSNNCREKHSINIVIVLSGNWKDHCFMANLNNL